MGLYYFGVNLSKREQCPETAAEREQPRAAPREDALGQVRDRKASVTLPERSKTTRSVK